MARFLGSNTGASLLNAACADIQKRSSGWARMRVEKVFLLLSDGRCVEETERDVLVLMRKHRSQVVHVIDVGQLVEDTIIILTEAMLIHRLVQPGANGRVPRKPAKASTTQAEK